MYYYLVFSNDEAAAVVIHCLLYVREHGEEVGETYYRHEDYTAGFAESEEM
jgi:hypothetical protein